MGQWQQAHCEERTATIQPRSATIHKMLSVSFTALLVFTSFHAAGCGCFLSEVANSRMCVAWRHLFGGQQGTWEAVLVAIAVVMPLVAVVVVVVVGVVERTSAQLTATIQPRSVLHVWRDAVGVFHRVVGAPLQSDRRSDCSDTISQYSTRPGSLPLCCWCSTSIHRGST
jgi:hypothetical protein